MRARVDKDGSSFKMSLKATIILAGVVAVQCETRIREFLGLKSA